MQRLIYFIVFGIILSGDNMNIIKSAIYQHYKGNKYRVLELATHTETMELMVVYQDVTNPDKIWVRPATMWNDDVDLPDKTVKRFTLINE